MNLLQDITYYLIGKQLFTHLDSKEYVNWAVKVLEIGFDSENIRILAGLDFDDTEERLKYFYKSLDDLNIQIPSNRNDILNDFTNRLANNVISGLESPRLGLKMMLDVVIASDYSERYIQFMDLDEDIDCVIYTGKPLFNSNLDKNNIDKIIINEFKLFLQIESTDLNIREMAYCKNCNKAMTPELKENYNIFRSHKDKYWCCSICGSRNLIYGNTQEGKAMIIKAIQ